MEGKLKPGGLALIINSGMTPENVGKIVETVARIGSFVPGESGVNPATGERFTATAGGDVWHVKATGSPLIAMILISGTKESVRERVYSASCLMPINPDEYQEPESTSIKQPEGQSA